MCFYDVVFLRRFITAAQKDDYFMMLSFVIDTKSISNHFLKYIRRFNDK